MGNSVPRAPGHEVAGVVDAVGDGVTTWSAGDRVGVGWFGGCDFTCEPCRRGDFISCENGQIPGISYDGGYAEYMVAPAEALARIPDDLSDVDAAPLLCAGITTFNALRESVARPGDLVADSRGRRTRPPRHPVRGQDGFRGRRHRARQRQGAACERAWRAPLHRFQGLRRRRGAQQARRRAGGPRDRHRLGRDDGHARWPQGARTARRRRRGRRPDAGAGGRTDLQVRLRPRPCVRERRRIPKTRCAFRR